jgi:ATP/maltotriose-dependent transcriptional regulator MalT
VDLCGRALAEARSLGAPPALVAEREERLGWYQARHGLGAEALETHRSALARASTGGGPATARVLTTMAHTLMRVGRVAEAAAVCDEAIGVAADRQQEATARRTAGSVLARQGRSDAALAQLQCAAALSLAGGEALDVLWAQVELATVLGDLGRRVDAVGAVLDALDRLGDRSPPTVANFLRCLAGDGFRRLGLLDDAAKMATASREAAAGPLDTAAAIALDGATHLDRGDLSVAADHLETARDLLRDVAEPHLWAAVYRGLAGCAYWRSEHGRAVDLVVGGIGHVSGMDAGHTLLPVALVGIRAAVEIGLDRQDEVAEVGEVCERLLETVTATPTPAPNERRATLLTAEAERGRLDGDQPERWEAAVTAWERLGQPLDTAMVRWGRGRALVAVGDRVRAREVLAGAHVDACRLGAVHLAHRIEATAARARIGLPAVAAGSAAPSPGEAAGPADPLTAREHDVLDLLAGGCDNADIAARLYISRKTASVHVCNICAKLHARNRHHAVVVAREAGLLRRGGLS